ncbi:MAG: type II toxin-antitoxin system prevent-host-death family antitoxin [Candidatus Dadabacteria bacterium]|nr:type II toxin-antitoxin system prevent-host-death family antitoxin [Candidatus Dadabacteria bacterium]
MKIAISEAKAKLSALVNAALAGEQVILTKHGRPVAEIKTLAAKKSPAEKLSAIGRIVVEARSKRLSGVSAAKADNFLYDDDTGLPS